MPILGAVEAVKNCGCGIARAPLRRLTFNVRHFSSSPVADALSLLVLFFLLAIPKCTLPLNVTF